MQNAYHRPEKLYFLPIGGTAMASLAGLLAARGHTVSGVDSQLYPPMSTLLEELRIPVRLGFDPELVPTEVDRVIIGNAVPSSNPEVVAVRRAGIPYLSQAEAVAHYLLAEGRRSMVVAGTHGKTTTASLLTWILEATGADPSALVGGLLQWSRRSFRLGDGAWMVIEGDEYNTSFFDRGPKFLHYRPEIFCLGPVEFDHADIYPDLDAVLTAFRAGTAQVPPSGAVVVNASSVHAREAVSSATAELLLVGESDDCWMRLSELTVTAEGSTATLRWQGASHRLRIPLAGRHNLYNAGVALAAAVRGGVELAPALAALADFPGVARRLEVVGEAACMVVVDDFAHHPTALKVTLAAARQKWPQRRLVAVYEPRSLSASRRSFQDAYCEALGEADVALVARPYHADRVAASELLDREAMRRQLAATGVATVLPQADEDPVAVLLPVLLPGDVIIGCSSGDFGGFHRRLLAELRARSEGNDR